MRVNILAAALQACDMGFALIQPFDQRGVFHVTQMHGIVVLVAGIKASLMGLEDTTRREFA